MATIKTLVAEQLHQAGQPTNEDIRKKTVQYLNGICATLPGENNRDRNPVGVEFADVMFLSESAFRTKDTPGKDLHEKAVNKLVEKIMDERDDLCDYPNLRQKILDTINQ